MKKAIKNTNEEKFNDLLKKIKGIKKITQGRISILAGYSTENYLSEAKSNNNITDSIIESLQILYEKAFRHPEILDSDAINLEKTEQQLIEERGQRIIALEVSMEALISIVLDQEQKLFKKSFSEVADLWKERTEKAHKSLMEKLKNG